MKVAVLGSGGREHALCWALGRGEHEVHVLPGNGGTGSRVAIDPTDLDGVLRFVERSAIDLVIVGPEKPLVAGIVDRLRPEGVRVFGPTAAGARLEGSKVWAKEFMARHGVATARFATFGPGDDAGPFVRELAGRVVVKLDGLAEGKGVVVCDRAESALEAMVELGERHGPDSRFVVEERLEGDEVSVLALTDGTSFALLPCCQDHKALLDSDQGPNTGGMGAYGPVGAMGPSRVEDVVRTIVRPTIAGIRAEGIDYRGVLYFGVMMTAAGPRLLEYNVRFGDPEAQAVLPLLETDLAVAACACIGRTLSSCALGFRKGVAVDVVLASGGYPGKADVGHEITGLDRLDPGTLVFHAGTRRDGDRLVTSGGRVLSVVRVGDDLDSTIRAAYDEVRKIRFAGMQYRTDIGRRRWTTDRG